MSEPVPKNVVTRKQNSFRDVYWCWIVFEPFFLSGDVDRSIRCVQCGWIEEFEGEFKGFGAMHEYVCTVNSPAQHRVEERRRKANE